MKVTELQPGKRVAWRCADTGGEWQDTELSFDLSVDGSRTTLLFGHHAWKQSSPFMAHCSMKWATFLLSLRDYVERGAGKPFPNDVAV